MNKELYDQLMEIIKYYNIKEVCELAEINPQVFRNFKSNPERYPLSDENIEKVLNAIKEINKKLK